MVFFCTHRCILVLSLLRLSFLLARSRMAMSQILCRRMWIPSFLFPPKAGVLLDIITSRRTFRRSGRYFCIMLHVRGVSCLTGWTHLHSEQKPSASQPLPLEMEKAGHWRWRWLEANELVQLRRLRTPLHGRLGPRRSV